MEYLLNNRWIEGEQKREMINAIMYYLDEKQLVLQNGSGYFRDCLEENLDLQRSLTRENALKIIGVIKGLNLKFKVLHDTLFVDSSVAKEIVLNKRFTIEFSNINKICDLYYHQTFDLGIFDFADAEVIEYVEAHIDQFIQNCLLHRNYKEKDYVERIEAFWKKTKDLGEDVRLKWLENENPCYENIEALVARHMGDSDFQLYLHTIFEKRYWKATWENIAAFYKYDNIEVDLAQMISEVISELVEPEVTPDKELMDYIMKSNVSDEVKMRVLKNVRGTIDAKSYALYLKEINGYQKLFMTNNKKYHTVEYSKGDYDEQIIDDLIRLNVAFDKQDSDGTISIKVRNIEAIEDKVSKALF